VLRWNKNTKCACIAKTVLNKSISNTFPILHISSYLPSNIFKENERYETFIYWHVIHVRIALEKKTSPIEVHTSRVSNCHREAINFLMTNMYSWNSVFIAITCARRVLYFSFPFQYVTLTRANRSLIPLGRDQPTSDWQNWWNYEWVREPDLLCNMNANAQQRIHFTSSPPLLLPSLVYSITCIPTDTKFTLSIVHVKWH